MSKAELFAAMIITIALAFVPLLFPQHLLTFLGIIAIVSVPALAVVIEIALKQERAGEPKRRPMRRAKR